jgi:hypothetical protein
MRRAALTTCLGLALALCASAPAFAESPATGAMQLQAGGPIVLHGRAYVLTGSVVTVTGVVKPYVPGQRLRVRISTPHRKPTIVRTSIRKGGTFQVRFRARRAVTYRIYARHNATAEQGTFAAIGSVGAVTRGSRLSLSLLKQGLRQLGYPAGTGSYVSGKLDRAVLAFRKTNSMARTTTIDGHVYAMVFAGRGAYQLRYPSAGKHVEADLSRQVVVLADNGKPVATYPTSSGKPATPTVRGHYHFYLKAPGTNAKGMYMSNYFIAGYAIHGYPSVPTYNASHGCLRVPLADAVAIFNQIDLGESIWVYA